MNAKSSDAREGARKPAGGFCLVRGTALLRAWEAYSQGKIRLVDLRVWFACLEAVARRCGLKRGRVATYRVEEVQKLAAIQTPNLVRKSIARLERAGLVQWSDSTITITEHREGAWTEDFVAMLDLVTNHRRLVPVPRRIVRLIASSGRRVLIATILGYLLRCLYYKGGLCLPEGTCKSSWIADVFCVNTRNVKAARKELISMGWVVPIATKQTCLNRFGGRVRINLEWSGNDINPAWKRSPLGTKKSTGSPPPYKDKKLSTRIKEPETRLLGPSGFEKQKKLKTSLRNVRPEDLRSTLGVCELFKEAVGEGVVKSSEADRLKFFSAAEHALSVGTKNPCGLFVAVVRRGLWTYLSQADEDRAVRRLKAFREAGDLVALDVKGVSGPSMKTCTPRPSGRSTQQPGEALDRTAIRALIAQSIGLSSKLSGLRPTPMAA